MGQNTRSQGLATFEFNMAAHSLIRFEIHKRSQLFYTIYSLATSWKVLRYHLERCITIPSYFTTTEWQNNWPFHEKEELSIQLNAYEDTKLLCSLEITVVALISTLPVFIILSSGF